MDGIDLLRREALLKRNTAILAAKREYHATLKEIAALKHRMGIRPRGRPRKVVQREDSTLKATTVAKAILMEGKAMTVVELVLEVQRRGCRALDDPRAVAIALRSGLRYGGRFRRDRDGRWFVVS
jgi:hypothetical protein